MEVSWLLHHDTMGEDMQMWLYGRKGGSHWPKCELYETNYQTSQHYNRSLKITGDWIRVVETSQRGTMEGLRR